MNMFDEPKPDYAILPQFLRDQMSFLNKAGFNLLPLGAGEMGKAPLRKFKGRNLHMAETLRAMGGIDSKIYGVRLPRHIVIDIDTDDPDVVQQVQAMFGESMVHVKSPRGRHLYYLRGSFIPSIDKSVINADVKTGINGYVAGPMSIRRDGGQYTPAKGVLGVTPLSTLREPPKALETPKIAPCIDGDKGAMNWAIPKGQRHNSLMRESLDVAPHVASVESLFQHLAKIKATQCEDPASLPDSELRGLASFAWFLREHGMIWKGRNSVFLISRDAMDGLKTLPNSCDAIALYAVLVSIHGHREGITFPMVWQRMREDGIIDLPEKRFHAARRGLIQLKLLKRVGKHLAGIRPQSFALIPPSALAVALPSKQTRQEQI